MFFLVDFFSLLFFSCKEDQPLTIKSRTETFTIKCNQSTTLKISNGDELVITDNTFDCATSENFKLTVNTVKTKKEIILSGLQTIDIDGRPLESAGMIQLDYPKSISINESNPIIHRSRTDHAYPDMQSFILDTKTNSWNLNDQKILIEGNDDILLGESLFNTKCAQCHSKKLDRDLTGPALAHVGKFRSMDWLIEYTKDSQSMIAKGDSLAVCSWDRWKPSLMPTNTNLSNSEIEAIYKYVENESTIRNIPIDSTLFSYPCDFQSYSDEGGIYTYNSMSTPSILTIPTSTAPIFTQPVNMFYSTDLLTRNWYNVDRYYGTDFKVSNPILRITNFDENTNACIVYKNENSVISFIPNSTPKEFSLQNSKGKDSIDWMEDTDLYIVAYTNNESEGTFKAIIKEIKFTKNNNDFTFTLKNMNKDKFNKLLESLDD